MTAVEDIARTAIKVRPVAGHIGADISGIDISQPLSSQEATEIQQALFRYKVYSSVTRSSHTPARWHSAGTSAT